MLYIFFYIDNNISLQILVTIFSVRKGKFFKALFWSTEFESDLKKFHYIDFLTYSTQSILKFSIWIFKI